VVRASGRAVVALLVLLAGGAPAVAATERCLDAAATAPFPDQALLESWSRTMADFGPRPTASRPHRAFVGWLRRRLRKIPGVELRFDRFSIDRQLERTATLRVDVEGAPREIPTAGPVPYSRLTGRRGARGPLVYVPAEAAIPAADAAGRILVRDHRASSIPYLLVRAATLYLHDPGMTFDFDAPYERDYLGYQSVLADLRDAAAGGAAGLVIVHEFPRDQVRGQYEPYEGVVWGVPALYLGVDEGQALKDLVAGGAAPAATLVLTGRRREAPTGNLVATLPGSGPERIVIASHTDGMNAVWDNGPIAMLALARWFAALPVECRPRALEFAFATAHLHLSEHGATRYADELKRRCDSVALAVALEHLGAKEYAAVPPDGGPGRTLVSTGLPEFLGMFVTTSPALLASAIANVVEHDLRRTGVLPFIPGVVSGEGAAYQERGMPTVALIAGPWSLYNPAFGIEAVDVDLLRRQALAIRDLVLDVQELPRETIAGGTPCTPE
jgi:hypothetical protein